MKSVFEWVVVGAGPAGIASIGKLLDSGIAASAIAWIDPAFKAGDFGTSWGYVMSNTPVESFTKFYRNCTSFNYPENPPFIIEKSSPDSTCPLMVAAQPLYWITDNLQKIINPFRDTVTSLAQVDNIWQLNLNSGQTIQAQKVILAVGGNAKELSFANITTIPLKTALDMGKIRAAIVPEDYVVLFGSAQSAKSVLKNLSSTQAQKIVLLYRSEHTLMRHIGDEEFEHIEMDEMTPRNLLKHMPKCTKVICAIGFERRHIPIFGLPDNYGYDKKTGEIAPGIYGIGMAFPEVMPYELGQLEYRVTAMWPFMKRLNKVLPLWMSS